MMSLPQCDIEHLLDRGLNHAVSSEGNMICIVIGGYVLPLGYNRASADLLLRLPVGYPDIPPDMWWFDPAICLADGRSIQATECIEHYLGRTWQRWSRHLNAAHWQSGVDGLESFLALLRKELERCVVTPVQ